MFRYVQVGPPRMGYAGLDRVDAGLVSLEPVRVDVGSRAALELIIPRTLPRRAASIAVGAIVLYGFVVLSGVVAVPIRTVIDNVGSALAALVVAGLALLAARAQPDRRSRASW